MNQASRILLALLLLASPAWAGGDVGYTQIPAPAIKAIGEYFPGAEHLSAEREGSDRSVRYEILIRYKAINLKVEVSADGRILDVDMKD